MKSLAAIQKTAGVLKHLAFIAMVLSFVAAGFALVGLVLFSRWNVSPPAFLAELFCVMDLGDTRLVMATLLADMAACCFEGLLLFNAVSYFKAELADGTPFTQTGAGKLRKLGVLTIVLPLVSLIVCSVIHAAFGTDCWDADGNGASLILGVSLIVMSVVCHYGAELRESHKLTVE